MSNLRVIRRRIRSIQNIRDITKAMEMIAGVRFKRIEERYKRSLPYGTELEKLISRLLSEELVSDHPLFKKRELRHELLIVITGDRGLCGGFNSTLLRQAQEYLAGKSSHQVTLYPVGRVGAGFVRRRGWPLKKTLTDLGYRFTREDLRPHLEEVLSCYLSGDFDEVKILRMRFIKTGIQRPAMEPFLGLRYLLETAREREGSTEGPEIGHSEPNYLFEPGAREALEALIDLFVRQRFFAILLGSVTAEYNARMIAMKLATDNAEEVIDGLTLLRNKVRQASITREMTELMSGVEALR